MYNLWLHYAKKEESLLCLRLYYFTYTAVKSKCCSSYNIYFYSGMSRKENPQKLTQLSSRSHPRHLVGKRTAQKDTIIDITSDSQVNSNFPNRWSPASLTFNNYFYLFLYARLKNGCTMLYPSASVRLSVRPSVNFFVSV